MKRGVMCPYDKDISQLKRWLTYLALGTVVGPVEPLLASTLFLLVPGELAISQFPLNRTPKS